MTPSLLRRLTASRLATMVGILRRGWRASGVVTADGLGEAPRLPA